MKKKMCLLLSIVLILTCMIPFSYAEESTKDFNPNIANAIEATASTWFSDSETRAMLTILLSFDLSNTLDNESSVSFELTDALTGTSYVGKSGINLVIIVCTDSAIISMYYCPAVGKAYYAVSETSIDTKYQELAVETILDSNCSDGYYKNDQEEILLTARKIVNAIGD